MTLCSQYINAFDANSDSELLLVLVNGKHEALVCSSKVVELTTDCPACIWLYILLGSFYATKFAIL